jgi:hypothetical protein
MQNSCILDYHYPPKMPGYFWNLLCWLQNEQPLGISKFSTIFSRQPYPGFPFTGIGRRWDVFNVWDSTLIWLFYLSMPQRIIQKEIECLIWPKIGWGKEKRSLYRRIGRVRQENVCAYSPDACTIILRVLLIRLLLSCVFGEGSSEWFYRHY